MSKAPIDFTAAFSQAAHKYDDSNSKLSKISEALHFLMTLVLRDLPVRSRVLCVGAGTGAEILSLSRAFPEWRFVALEPSLPMLEICKERLRNAGVEARCEFVNGYIQDLPSDGPYDAVLSILVGHFVSRDSRAEFYKNMVDRLRVGGAFVNAEISFDLNSEDFPAMLNNWKGIQELMGATPESLAALPKQLREILIVLSPEEVQELIHRAGIKTPVPFFQAFMIKAWHGKKES